MHGRPQTHVSAQEHRQHIHGIEVWWLVDLQVGNCWEQLEKVRISNHFKGLGRQVVLFMDMDTGETIDLNKVPCLVVPFQAGCVLTCCSKTLCFGQSLNTACNLHAPRGAEGGAQADNVLLSAATVS